MGRPNRSCRPGLCGTCSGLARRASQYPSASSRARSWTVHLKRSSPARCTPHARRPQGAREWSCPPPQARLATPPERSRSPLALSAPARKALSSCFLEARAHRSQLWRGQHDEHAATAAKHRGATAAHGPPDQRTRHASHLPVGCKQLGGLDGPLACRAHRRLHAQHQRG